MTRLWSAILAWLRDPPPALPPHVMRPLNVSALAVHLVNAERPSDVVSTVGRKS